MEKTFDLEIITPFNIIYQSKVRHIRMPGIEGYFGILAGHAPLVTTLGTGEIKVDLENNETKYFATSGGTVEVLPGVTKVLVETAEEATKIDVERAIYAKERADRRIIDKTTDIDIKRARSALIKAINRIRISRKVKGD